MAMVMAALNGLLAAGLKIKAVSVFSHRFIAMINMSVLFIPKPIEVTGRKRTLITRYLLPQPPASMEAPDIGLYVHGIKMEYIVAEEWGYYIKAVITLPVGIATTCPIPAET